MDNSLYGICFQKSKTNFTAARYNGYVTLCKIMMLVHPIIMEEKVEFKNLNKANTTPFTVNVNNIMKFLEREYLWGYPITEYQ